MKTVRSKIVRIGNSRGVRIPKPVFEQSGLSGDVEISVEGNTIVISSVDTPRSSWSDAFARMAEAGDDKLLDSADPVPSSWDDEEWEWK